MPTETEAGITNLISYSTADLGRASYLYGVNQILVNVDDNDPTRLVFFFDLTPEEFNKVTDGWFRGECIVDARAYYSAYQYLKRKKGGRANYE